LTSWPRWLLLPLLLLLLWLLLLPSCPRLLLRLLRHLPCCSLLLWLLLLVSACLAWLLLLLLLWCRLALLLLLLRGGCPRCCCCLPIHLLPAALPVTVVCRLGEVGNQGTTGSLQVINLHSMTQHSTARWAWQRTTQHGHKIWIGMLLLLNPGYLMQGVLACCLMD
jgi:hypothetical protein